MYPGTPLSQRQKHCGTIIIIVEGEGCHEGPQLMIFLYDQLVYIYIQAKQVGSETLIGYFLCLIYSLVAATKSPTGWHLKFGPKLYSHFF